MATRSVLLIHVYSNVSRNRTADTKHNFTLSASRRGYHSETAFPNGTLLLYIYSQRHLYQMKNRPHIIMKAVFCLPSTEQIA